MSEISKSEVRIILLYCTQAEAKVILTNGAKVGLNSSNYLWIVTQSVVGDTGEKMMGLADSYHVGMLGVHFNPSLNPDNTAVLRVRYQNSDLTVHCYQLSYAIKTQIKAPKASYERLWVEITSN